MGLNDWLDWLVQLSAQKHTITVMLWSDKTDLKFTD